MDDSNDLVSLIVYIDDNFLNQRPYHAPLEQTVGSLMIPYGFEILSDIFESDIFELFRSYSLDSLTLPLLFDPQFGVPDPL